MGHQMSWSEQGLEKNFQTQSVLEKSLLEQGMLLEHQGQLKGELMLSWASTQFL